MDKREFGIVVEGNERQRMGYGGTSWMGGETGTGEQWRRGQKWV